MVAVWSNRRSKVVCDTGRCSAGQRSRRSPAPGFGFEGGDSVVSVEVVVWWCGEWPAAEHDSPSGASGRRRR